MLVRYSTNGHVDIVKELLKADHKLCLVKGRERRIPFHYVAIKGRVDVTRELILTSAGSVVDTVLHLATKNNQFEAFKDLVEHLKKFNKEDVLNRKDDQGNTCLHLVVSKKQYELHNRASRFLHFMTLTTSYNWDCIGHKGMGF
ncbi:hypothetical protein HYC85_010694 [Camellia sinensis]|uniref:PGG domain-containing protein n=1 Tax=Camellia sinensis TaxID=4442 RepID=A0A7J7HIL6_CAMSI|nr:hypothetical protein HYC85_010694 [Camellia sinensis]